ncbi:hypothetical protein A6X21_13340 [Planctopirus hydrillae]|uniref:DUF2203 domain-containing protein n=2 Tax=Planctopirus hydrillae TaxID=1841610 RepID=A0A1C3E5Y6_9PLAN|nr:hypothetical protein A6X21_13340 [Planctopirus hydrillae]
MPLVQAITKDIVELHRDLLARHSRLQEMKSRHRRANSSAPLAYREEVEQIQYHLAQDEQRLEGYVAELEALGVVVRDRSVGLIDFPTKIDGVDATLSWKIGEPEIAHWYGVGHLADVRSPLSAEQKGDPQTDDKTASPSLSTGLADATVVPSATGISPSGISLPAQDALIPETQPNPEGHGKTGAGNSGSGDASV